MIRLIDLEPLFYGPPQGMVLPHVESLAEAAGVRFRCPVCSDHSIICWSRSVKADNPAAPMKGRWNLLGTGAHDLTLDGVDRGSSVALVCDEGTGCGAHFFISGGLVTLV